MKFIHIDSIRAIAILLVILTHLGPIFKELDLVSYYLSLYGQMGVQLFFIASAFTLSNSSDNRQLETNKYKKYALRRFFRIAPVYYLAILMYSLFPIVIKYSSIIPAIFKQSIPIIVNIFFINSLFPNILNKVVPGGWSISTEVLFYLIFPIIFILINNSKLLIILLVFVLTILFSQIGINILYYMGYPIANNSFSYFNILNQITVFVIGICYYQLSKAGHMKLNVKVDMALFICLTLTSLYLWRLKIDYLFSIIPIISGLSFVFLIEIFRKINYLNLRFLTKIGQASYSMYLFHFLVIDLFKLLLKVLNMNSGTINFIISYLLVLGITFIIANLSKIFYEDWWVNFGNKLISRI